MLLQTESSSQHDFQEGTTSQSVQACKMRKRNKLFFYGMFTFLVAVSLLLSSFSSFLWPTKQYEDCWEALSDGADHGVYPIAFKDIESSHSKLAYCENGMTLIQKTDPFVGNRKHYFERSFKEYEQGFGQTGKEYFLGFKYILSLIKKGNNVLHLKLTMQENGTQFWVEMDNFTMIHNVSGNLEYFAGESIFETNELYPVISVGNVTSSISNDTTVLLVPPYYFGKTLEERKKIAAEVYGYSIILVAAGFETYDHGKDNLCPTESRSGWWFSKNVFYPYGCPKPKQVLCDHNITHHTNLNGYYHDDPNFNQRSIVICKSKDLDECFIEYPRFSCNRGDVESNNNLESIKLTKTEMYVTKRP